MPATDILDFDRRHVWHPYASTLAPAVGYVVQHADGCMLTLHDGQQEYRVIDAMASWWCMIHGYRHPQLDAALHTQIEQFSHVMFGGLTHEPATRVVQALLELTPPGLDRVFLADSGSVAMEVALKLARQTQLARTVGSAHPRTMIAALRGGYHGDTLGAMSVCDPVGGMHAMFADAIPAQIFLPRPPKFAASAAEISSWAADVKKIVHTQRDQLAGIIAEPILQGAGGMWSYAPEALRVLRNVADDYDLVLIFDEIATGFGRTGKLWASQWADVIPDVHVVGKALTGGYLTQAAVICTDALATEIGRGPAGALMHGPTFMANPLACAASLASLNVIAHGMWQDGVARAEKVLTRELDQLRTHPAVVDVRVLGATAAVELRSEVDVKLATTTAIDHGVWIRPFRNLIYAMPPYICTEAELITIAQAMRAAVQAVYEKTLNAASHSDSPRRSA